MRVLAEQVFLERLKRKLQVSQSDQNEIFVFSPSEEGKTQKFVIFHEFGNFLQKYKRLSG
jgi:hypothetical protein